MEDQRKHLMLRHVRELLNALAFAGEMGRWPRWHVTLIWRHCAGFIPGKWAERQTKLIVQLQRWLRRHGVEPLYLWVRENGRQKGPHTHIFITCPDRVIPALPPFLVRAGRFTSGGVHVNTQPSNAHSRRMGLMKYWLKGMNCRDFRYVFGEGTVNVMDVLGVEHRGDMLPVEIKRAGVCHRLGPAARRQAGWREMCHLSDLGHYLNSRAAP
ncbi:MAG: hypothetical protein HY985_03205 [Magnetospirillum sp.]|nr:hypothetical protein [Magnetospirillum sp.]